MKKWLKKYVNPIIPLYAVIPLLFGFFINSFVYIGSRVVAGSLYHYEIGSKLDDKIPFIPQFILIYLGCYLFWIINYILIAKQGKEYYFRFAVADILSRVVCGIFFCLLPTTNIRPELVGKDIWIQAVRWLYETDAADNLFPSIHCLASWFCYIGIRGRKNISFWYRNVSCIIALLVFLSTLVLKQHVIIDIIGAVLLAECLYWLTKRYNWYIKYMAISDKVSITLFGTIE